MCGLHPDMGCSPHDILGRHTDKDACGDETRDLGDRELHRFCVKIITMDAINRRASPWGPRRL